MLFKIVQSLTIYERMDLNNLRTVIIKMLTVYLRTVSYTIYEKALIFYELVRIIYEQVCSYINPV